MVLKRPKLPTAVLIALGSLVFMILFMSLTSPVNKIAYAIVFFINLLVFLVSAGYGVVKLQNGQVSAKARFRIWVVSLLILVAIMLRSAQSLSLVDFMIVILICFGLSFYANRRV